MTITQAKTVLSCFPVQLCTCRRTVYRLCKLPRRVKWLVQYKIMSIWHPEIVVTRACAPLLPPHHATAGSEIRQESENPFSQRFVSIKLQESKWILVKRFMARIHGFLKNSTWSLIKMDSHTWLRISDPALATCINL